MLLSDGVLAPFLWCLLLDALLIMLERVRVYTQAYTDDLTVLIGGKYGSCIRYNTAGPKYHRKWCMKGRLSVNPDLSHDAHEARKLATLRN